MYTHGHTHFITGSTNLWSAWTALGALYPSAEAVAKLPIPEHWMNEFFSAHVALEAQVRLFGLTPWAL